MEEAEKDESEVDRMNSDINFRYAERKDIPLILHFVKELAEYEKMSKASNPYGDGLASKRIADILVDSK